jgi:hypothetical protein
MEYAKLKQEIKEIAEIAAGVPDLFKQKCFEILLTHLVSQESKEKKKEDKDTSSDKLKGELPITTQLRVFMQKTRITEEELRQVVMFADNDVHFIKEPSPSKIADGQIEWSLLLALKNCILNNAMSVDPESVRSVCQEKGCYDSPNFAAIFKCPKYKKFFKELMEPQGEVQTLSKEGQDELASLIRKLGANL